LSFVYGKLTIVSLQSGWAIYLCAMQEKVSFFPLVLALMVLFGSFKASFSYAYYFMDTDGFIQTFCENVDKPELDCRAKCFLNSINQEVPGDADEPQKHTFVYRLLLYPTQLEQLQLNLIDPANKTNFRYQNGYSQWQPLTGGQPPELV